jgi:spore coat protein JB
MNYNYDYGNYMPSMNVIPKSYGYDNKMSYKGNQAKVTFMDKNNMNNKVPVGYGNTMVSNSQLVEPYVGFIRGNLFNNLYDPYKNYKPSDIEVSNERESLLGQIQMYNFAVTDLNLYLDLYPNDTRAVQMLEEYSKAKKELSNQYEMKYGPLMVSDVVGNNFDWIDNPWPWEANI